MEIFEIGELVHWFVGTSNTLCRAIVSEDNGDNVDVVCYEINNQPTRKKINVLKSKIIRDENRKN